MLHSSSVSGGGTKEFFVEKIGSSFKVIILTHEYLQNICYAEPYLGNNRDEIFEVLLMISGGERQCIIESLNSSSFFFVSELQ